MVPDEVSGIRPGPKLAGMSKTSDRNRRTRKDMLNADR